MVIPGYEIEAYNAELAAPLRYSENFMYWEQYGRDIYQRIIDLFPDRTYPPGSIGNCLPGPLDEHH